LDEFELIQRFFGRQATDPAVRIGVGDDGAVVQPANGLELVTAIDTLVEGVHFPAGLDADAVGYRAVAVNLSDIAAMGARPRWMTLALTLDEADEAWLERFASGLFAAAEPHSVSLVGGDTTHGAQKVVTIQINGDAEAGSSLRRAGAVPGDLVFVSGSFGDAAAGLSFITNNDTVTGEKRALADRFCRPTARVAFGQALTGVASAAIDVSDGLYADLHKLLQASGVGGVIETESIPLSRELKTCCGDNAALQFALTGGDDYELCFTAAPVHEKVVSGLAAQCHCRVTRVGEVIAGNGLACTREGRAFEFEHGGYRHF